MGLDDYNKKRNFDQSPEPAGKIQQGSGDLRFLVQLHHASHIHYDFRIEAGGVFKSWAVPKGPSLNPQDQRLAVQVEDHPLSYGTFEGTIPAGNYGAGAVMLWDEGTYQERNSDSREESEKAVLRAIGDGHVTMVLSGQKLAGEFALIRLKDAKSWLLVKKRDEYAQRTNVLLKNLSVQSGRSVEEIAAHLDAKPDLAKLTPTVVAQRMIEIPSAALNSTSNKTRPEKLPRKNRPMIATVFPETFQKTGWIFELDRGGVRALAELENGAVHFYSKQNLSFEKKFPKVFEALKKVKIAAVLDGEIASDGKLYYVSDLLHLEGQNIRTLPLIERKKRLGELPIFNETIVFSSYEEEDGQSLWQKARDEHQVGILAKQSLSQYHAGTTKAWLSIRLPQDQTSPSEGLRFSHLDKIYWPEEKFTKGDLIDYYRKIAEVLLTHLQGKPESLHRHPGGITETGFFQKNLIGHHPRWVETEPVYSKSIGKSIDYLVCSNTETLLYMANLGCIEINPWLSRRGSLDRPEAVVIDLDPDKQDFREVIAIAQTVHEILTKMGADHYVKTSGASGLHIFIPVQGGYTYQVGREFALAVCQVVHDRHPQQTSLERTPAKRRGKLYLDCLQNAQGQTVASVYSVRPLAGAPVSTPLRWEELTPDLRPEQFTIKNVPDRVTQLGDLWRPVLEKSVDLEKCLTRLR